MKEILLGTSNSSKADFFARQLEEEYDVSFLLPGGGQRLYGYWAGV